MGLGMILYFAAAAHAECAPLAEALEAATRALVDGTETSPAFAAAEASLACGPASREELARLWLLHGAALHLTGDLTSAEAYFAAAFTLSPAGYDDRLGPTVRAAFEAAKHGDPGRLTASRPVSVDGKKLKRFPATLESGPHAVVASDAGWARVVVILPNDDLVVEVPPPGANAPTAIKGKSPAWLIAGGVALAGAVGCGAGAYTQTSVMSEAETTSDLDAGWATQQALGYSAIGLGALGASGLVLHFVLP
ncbi:hypothetical protein LBMAG42_25020 [Deltaproteobacteria bacterium]|nr:hypothetical protein LBMAG42_25020 [Deltaproteobacteria bacterium]